jgi:hypothetical protein
LTAWSENIEYFNYCNEIKSTPNWKNWSYYCGVLTVNGTLISAWIWVSHLNPIWKFKLEFINKNWEKAWANKEAFIGWSTNWIKPVVWGKTIDWVWYSEHVLARMQPIWMQYVDVKWLVIDWRWIPPIIIKNVLKNWKQTTWTREWTIDIIYDNIFITVSKDLKRIITVIKKSWN